MRTRHSRSLSPKENESPFMKKLRERKIIAVVAAYVGSGVVLVEFAFHILVHHYHLPGQIVDIIIITLAAALLSTVTWSWFRGIDKKRRLKVEIPLIAVFIVAGAFLNVKQILKVVKEKPKHAETFHWENSIAVLPFENLSGDQDQDYFCDGLTEEVINALSNIADLKVVARTSSFAFKGQHLDVRDIGRELRVQNILEGSVRKGGDRLRITAQLINVSDGYHLWSGRFDREVEDVFAIQDEISLTIADVLSLKILGETRKEIIEHGTKNSRAYDLYLRGKFIANNITEENLITAIGLFENAIEEDPNFTLAYVALAEANSVLPALSTTQLNTAYAKAKQYALKALKIDGSLAEAHTMMGIIKSNEYDWEGAERSFLKSIEINPGYALTYNRYGNLLAYQGRFDKAEGMIKKAIELDPYNLNLARAFGRILFIAGKHDQAINVLEATRKINPNFTAIAYNLALIYLEKSEYERARKEIQWEKEAHATWNPALNAVDGIILAREGRLDESRQILKSLVEKSKDVHVSSYWMAALSLALGEIDQGIGLLERAYEEKDFFVSWLNVDPLFRSVHSDPRFKEILKNMGFDKKLEN